MRGPTFYYDLPGNHDASNNRTSPITRLNSVQGRAKKGPQLSWTHWLGDRKVPQHFLGVNTSGNTGGPFSLSFPYGDTPGSTR